MSLKYRFGTEVLEKEGAVVDIQVTHETQTDRGQQQEKTSPKHSEH